MKNEEYSLTRQQKLQIAQEILQDNDLRKELEKDLLHYADLLKDIEKRREQYISEAKDEMYQLFRQYMFDYLGDGQYIQPYERAIVNIHFSLEEIENKNKKQEPNQWERKYHHATQQVQIGDVIRHFLGVDNLRRNISCPFHEDKNPSFHVYENQNRFHCFSCAANGSPINFVRQFKNCDFKEAVELLNFF